jgi:glycosyltransferase involved in cell wall biosynthesis
MLISCIVLTRNNRDDVRRTLTSVLSQRPAVMTRGEDSVWPWSSEIVCIDSSDVPLAESEIFPFLTLLPPPVAKAFSLQLHHQFPPQGVYPAMNLAISLARGDHLIFMNAGDSFYDETSLHRLFSAAEACRLDRGKKPRLVFGQALIAPGDVRVRPWLVPDPSVRSIGRWLRFFLPNHQTVLVDRDWAAAHPFRLDAPQSADRAWLRDALAPPSLYVYLPQPVAVFCLGGLSSGLPNLRTLRLRLAEPSRTWCEKAAEIIKFFIRPLAPIYPSIMRFKSAFVGHLCR